MSDKPKICPHMSRPVSISEGGVNEIVPEMQYVNCVKSECPMWIQVYTTENRLTGPDCAYAFAPMMHNGLLRV